MSPKHLSYVMWQVFQDHTIRLFSGGRAINILFVLSFVTAGLGYAMGYELGLGFLVISICAVIRYGALLMLFNMTYKVRHDGTAREHAFQSLFKLYTEDVHKNATWLLAYYDNYLNPTKEEGKE